MKTSGTPSVIAELSQDHEGMCYPPSYLWYQRGAECDGKGEPGCHPSRFSRAAASPANKAAKPPYSKVFTPRKKTNGGAKNSQNTYKSFFTPREFSCRSLLLCVKKTKTKHKSPEKAFPSSKLSKGEGRPISTAVLLSVSRRPLLAWYCTPQWSLRYVCAAQSLFWCWTWCVSAPRMFITRLLLVNEP